jgi:hypothetical protein
LCRGGALAIGERGVLVVPHRSLGAERAEIVRYDEGVPRILVPAGARLRVDGAEIDERVWALARDSNAEIHVGGFVVRLTRGPAGSRPAGASLGWLRESGAGYFAGSAAFHAAIFAAVALFAPSLGAAEEDPLDPDRLALIHHLLDASAAREMDRTLAGSQAGSPATGGPSAEGAEGASGPRAAIRSTRRALPPGARPVDAARARERDLEEAAQFGLVGILPGALDSWAGAAGWSRPVPDGAGDSSERLYGGALGDVLGSGLGALGPGEGGGGPAHAIGLGGFSLGTVGGCSGPGPCDGVGVGVGRGEAGTGHPSHFKGPRYEKDIWTNGRLPPEIIQRIVRMNDGRYRACYERGLRTNPALAGRVTVKFVVDRTGAVALATDGGSDIPDESVRRCVIAAFGSLTFPAPDSGTVTVAYPIVFSPQ